MPTGTGLDAQCGFAAESTWGTAVTVTRFLELENETLTFEPTFTEGVGLRPGVLSKRITRTRRSRKSVAGDVSMEWATKGMGLLVKHMLGSSVTTPTLIAASAYKQVHTPTGLFGLGLTTQIGKPEPGTGTVIPHTYSGCKVPSWEFMCDDSSNPKLKLSLLGRSETTATALASASYLAGSTVFSFSDTSLKLGGTPSTSGGETTIASGTQLAAVAKSITISSESPMDDERFGLGNAGLRSQPLQNNMQTYKVSLDTEYAKTELYDPFQAGTVMAIQFDLTGDVISGSDVYRLSFIMPACLIKSANPVVSGPDIVRMTVEAEAYSNSVDPTLQVKIVSDESASI
jgi:hypothetical protein